MVRLAGRNQRRLAGADETRRRGSSPADGSGAPQYVSQVGLFGAQRKGLSPRHAVVEIKPFEDSGPMRSLGHIDGVGRMEGRGIVESSGVDCVLSADAIFAAEKKAPTGRTEVAHRRAPRAHMGQFSVEKPVAPGSVLSGNQHTEVWTVSSSTEDWEVLGLDCARRPGSA